MRSRLRKLQESQGNCKHWQNNEDLLAPWHSGDENGTRLDRSCACKMWAMAARNILHGASWQLPALLCVSSSGWPVPQSLQVTSLQQCINMPLGACVSMCHCLWPDAIVQSHMSQGWAHRHVPFTVSRSNYQWATIGILTHRSNYRCVLWQSGCQFHAFFHSSSWSRLHEHFQYTTTAVNCTGESRIIR